jgi:hypothetical protein
MAATVIDELIVQLGLDATKFTAGQKAAMESAKKVQEELLKQSKATEERTTKILDFFSKLKREAIGVLAALAGAGEVKQFLTNLAQMDSATGRLATTLGLNVKDIALWQNVTKLMGGTAEEGAQSVGQLQLELAKIASGGLASSQLPGLLSRLAINMHGANGEMKDASQILLELHDAIKILTPAQATLMLQQAGLSQNLIAALLQTDEAYKNTISRARELGSANAESAKETQELVTQFAAASQGVLHLGRVIAVQLGIFKGFALIFKGFSEMAESLSKLFAGNTKENPTGAWMHKNSLADLIATKLGVAHETIPAPTPPAAGGAAGGTVPGRPGGGSTAGTAAVPGKGMSTAETIDYIRKSAVAHGIDPDVAVAVAKSEGLTDYVGDRGSSFGPFQLHYGNVAGGGMAVGGLGDTFTKKTGLDARDPDTIRQQIDFALTEAQRGGWGPWHGWRGPPTAGGAGTGGTGGTGVGSGTTMNITGPITVNTPDAASFGSDLKQTINRQAGAAAGNINY